MCAHESPPFRCELHILRLAVILRKQRRALPDGQGVRALKRVESKRTRYWSSSDRTRRKVEFKALDVYSEESVASTSHFSFCNLNFEFVLNNLRHASTQVEIGDELKIVLVTAIERVCAKFHAKFELLLNFLALALREDNSHVHSTTKLLQFSITLPETIVCVVDDTLLPRLTVGVSMRASF